MHFIEFFLMIQLRLFLKDLGGETQYEIHQIYRNEKNSIKGIIHMIKDLILYLIFFLLVIRHFSLFFS